MWNEGPDPEENPKEGGKKKLRLREIGLDKLVIMGLCGVFLLVLSLPSFSKKEEATKSASEQDKNLQSAQSEPESLEAYVERMEEKLSGVLRRVNGVGSTEVMITVKGTKEKVTLKDRPYTKEESRSEDLDGRGSESTSLTQEDESILVDDASGEKTPYVIKETEPEIEGVIVLAKHGDQAVVQQEIIEAVQALFDVPIHKIKVMKLTDSPQ